MFEMNPIISIILFGLYVLLLGIIYYFIYKEHHKRNKIEFNELINLIVKFYTTVTVSLIIIFLGIYCIIDANDYKDDRLDVISHVSLGIVIISATIINFIFYLKRSLVDLNLEIREQNKKQTMKIGQVLELIIFVLFIFVPFYRIPYMIEIFYDKKEFFSELIRDILISIASIFLLITLNPCKIKEKVKNIFKKENLVDEKSSQKNKESE